jgi:hypothetical protein
VDTHRKEKLRGHPPESVRLASELTWVSSEVRPRGTVRTRSVCGERRRAGAGVEPGTARKRDANPEAEASGYRDEALTGYVLAAAGFQPALFR